MVSQFYEYINKLKAENIQVHTEIIYQSSHIKTSFIVQVSKNDIDSSLLNYSLFNNSDLSVFIEGKTPNNPINFKSIIQSEIQRKEQIKILFSYAQSFNLKDPKIDQIEINLFSTEIYKEFIKLIESNFCVKDLTSLKYKINIKCDEIEEIADTELLVFNKSKQNISNETLNYIKSLHNREASIFSIPNSLPQKIDKEIIILVIPDLLSQLSTNHGDNYYRFIGKRVIIFNTTEIIKVDNPDKLFSTLEKTIKFIYGDTKTTDQKLTFYRKTLIDGHLKDHEYKIEELDANFFEKLFIDSENVYDAFQDDAVSTFLKEKKEIIKEYMNISKEVISSINNIKNSLIRNLITLLALLISNFALKNKGITDTTDYILITGIASLFVFILIIIHYINDQPLESTITKKVKIFDEHFKFISSSSTELKDSIKETVEVEIGKYKSLLTLVGILYVLIFVILFSIFITIVL